MIEWNETQYHFAFQSRSGTVGKFMGRTAFRLESTAKILATQEKLVRTGRYRASIAARVLSEGGGLVIKFGSAVRHARILERGSEAHVIAARRKQALWWDMPNDRGWMEQPDDGRPVRYVLHPGTRPYQILHRAILLVTRGGIAR